MEKIVICFSIIAAIGLSIFLITNSHLSFDKSDDKNQDQDQDQKNQDQDDLTKQIDGSINIVNNTGENPLHVFLQLNLFEDPSEQWKKIGG